MEQNSQNPELRRERDQKRHELFVRQKAMLGLFLEKHAISGEQYQKSLHDMAEKMGETDQPEGRIPR